MTCTICLSGSGAEKERPRLAVERRKREDFAGVIGDVASESGVQTPSPAPKDEPSSFSLLEEHDVFKGRANIFKPSFQESSSVFSRLGNL